MSTATPAIATVVWPLTVFYDASCPLCREEMHALKEYDVDDRLRLRDASAARFEDRRCTAAGIATADLMRLIHAVDGAGRWYRGIAVFELAYGAAGLKSVERWFASRTLRPLWERIYPWIARFRQPLSALRLNRAYGAWVRRAARHAQRRAHACQAGRCDIAGH